VDARTVYVNLGKPASEDISASRIHDRQVDALLAIDSKLEQAPMAPRCGMYMPVFANPAFRHTVPRGALDVPLCLLLSYLPGIL
jgi:hypothetical protein